MIKSFVLYNINRYLIAGYINIKSRLIYPNDTKDFRQIASLYYDEQLNRLWIGTGAAGLFYYDIIKKLYHPYH